MFNRDVRGLKGQYNLARGKRRVAPGWEAGRQIVRERKLIKERMFYRAKERTVFFPEMIRCFSVREGLFALFIEFSRTVFSVRRYSQTLSGAGIF